MEQAHIALDTQWEQIDNKKSAPSSMASDARK